MPEIKTQYPFIHFNGEKDFGLIKHYAQDENGVYYNILQVETGEIYSEAIDIYPCKFTYVATKEPIKTEEDVKDETQGE